ncbi:MAG: DNA methylase [Bacteroidaceae bacterium]|nr:DNA methylase [Bacteroidaceae bacterium]
MPLRCRFVNYRYLCGVERTYIAIDLKSFYASVECVERGLDAMRARLVVADESRTDKTICLAVSPALKAYGIPGRPRLFEVVQRVRDINRRHPGLHLDYIVAPPRMALYMQYSTRIFGIYLRHVDAGDIHVYSVDEVFIDATPYLPALGITAREFALRMIREVFLETGITATAGIGTNLYLAKVAMDIVAKHVESDKDGVRIAELDEAAFRRQLWNHRPLTDFWRLGHGTEAHLQRMGVHTMGQLARLSLTHEEWLFREFGVNAELLIDHAWGWEPVTIADIKAYRPATSSLSSGQVLACPYEAGKARVVVQEMAEGLSLELLEHRCVCRGVDLYVGYDRESLTRPGIGYAGDVVADRYGRPVPKPAHGSRMLSRPTNSRRELTDAVLDIFDRVADTRLLVRRLTLAVQQVVTEQEAAKETNTPRQLDLFTDYEAEREQENRRNARLQRERKVQEAMLSIRKRFGKNAILHGISFAEGATARERNKQIGGHHE